MKKLIRTILALVLVISSPISFASELKVLTYNVWGLNVSLGSIFGKKLGLEIAADVDERLPLICDALRDGYLSGRWDVVLLQEVWRVQDRKMMKECGFPDIVGLDDFNPLRPVDSGLMILSRYPILESNRLLYSENGSFTNIIHDGEWAARKSAIIAKIQVPLADPKVTNVWVVNTHLLAQSGSDESYMIQRQGQLNEFMKWAMERSMGESMIIGGDFNINLLGKPEEDRYEAITEDLKKTFSKFNRLQDRDDCTLCPINEWNKDKEWGLLDHLIGSKDLTPISGGVTFNQKTYKNSAGEMRYLSDHFGWETVFRMP